MLNPADLKDVPVLDQLSDIRRGVFYRLQKDGNLFVHIPGMTVNKTVPALQKTADAVKLPCDVVRVEPSRSFRDCTMVELRERPAELPEDSLGLYRTRAVESGFETRCRRMSDDPTKDTVEGWQKFVDTWAFYPIGKNKKILSVRKVKSSCGAPYEVVIRYTDKTPVEAPKAAEPAPAMREYAFKDVKATFGGIKPEETEPRPFAVGDCVHLIGEGNDRVTMVVSSVHTDMVSVYWIDLDGKPACAVYPQKLLVHAD